MLNLLLILLGLISNPTTTSNCGSDDNPPTIANPNPADTGGDTAHPIPPKIVGG
ncbi:hypothetical protein [Epilithonimonas sp.]|jgi:hypothetical protein|uniref:hypothetical protein n=1 Tax=Epilithonimonas sp. TaxID=2894511 RepID=UPI0035AE72B2